MNRQCYGSGNIAAVPSQSRYIGHYFRMNLQTLLYYKLIGETLR